MAHKAFVSSTFKDLRHHREVVIKALRRAGIHVDPMEDWPASWDEPKQFSQKRVEGCDLCVLLVARRRGFVPIGEAKSITQLEYEYAMQHAVHVLPFLLSDDALWQREFDEIETDPAHMEWRVALMLHHGTEFFTHDPSSIDILPAVARWLENRQDVAPGRAVALAPLPVPDATFIGRVRELDELRDLLKKENARLTTLLGGPGLGKTRLALELAARLKGEFEGNCCFVELAEQQTVAGISNAVAQALGVRLTNATNPQDSIADILGSRPETLLVLDNFEQVVKHAQATVGLWRSKAPAIQFLVTSRAVLGLDGETCYWLHPLPEPPLSVAGPMAFETIAANDSVRLFVDRARRKNPRFALDPSNAETLARLCCELEGIPLSIKLAADRANILSPQSMLVRVTEQLKFLKSREMTLQGTIAWSYKLLQQHEQNAFEQACIFRDGFSIEAAEAIIELSPGSSGAVPDVIDAIQQLCEHSLLITVLTAQNVTRFEMFKAIEEFGQSIWDQPSSEETPPAALFARYAEYFIAFAERQSARVDTPACRDALDDLVLERENLLAVQRRALALGEPEVAARAILAFARALEVRGPGALRVPLLSRSLVALGDRAPQLRARLLAHLSDAHWATGQWKTATELADQAVQLACQLGDAALQADALVRQARMRNADGDRPGAIASFEEAERIYHDCCDVRGTAICWSGLGHIYDRLGDHARSLELFSRAEEALRRLGDVMALVRTLNYQGLALWHSGDPWSAVERFAEAESKNRALGDVRWVAANLTNRGLALTDSERFDEALACFDEADKIHSELGNKAWGGINLGSRGRALMSMGRLDEALADLDKAEAVAAEVSDREDEALHAGNRGRTLLKLGRIDEANDALRRTIALQERIGGNHDNRFFGNLVTLAITEKHFGRTSEVRRLLDKARALADSLGLTVSHPVRAIREDHSAMRELSDWLRHQDPLSPPQPDDAPSENDVLDLHGRKVTAVQAGRLAALIVSLRCQTGYAYPWDELTEEMLREGRSHLALVGYGSLISVTSAARTITSAPPGGYEPVIAFGVSRLFNYEMPPEALKRYGTPVDSPARAALNVRVTYDLRDAINGVLVQVIADDIPSLRDREPGYDLRPVVCLPWNDLDADPFVAYVLAAPDGIRSGRTFTSSTIEPHGNYLRLCIDAARALSEPFLKFFIATTFQSDGVTRIETPDPRT